MLYVILHKAIVRSELFIALTLVISFYVSLKTTENVKMRFTQSMKWLLALTIFLSQTHDFLKSILSWILFLVHNGLEYANTKLMAR